MSNALSTFIIYSRDDKHHKELLLKHLKPLSASAKITVWHDGDILPGEDWELAIKQNIKSSDLILVLVSVNSLNSDFIQTEELSEALIRFKEGRSRIIPIIVDACAWNLYPVFNNLQGLPDDMRPVSSWPNVHEAWTNVVGRINEIITLILEKDIRQKLGQEIQQKVNEVESEKEVFNKNKLNTLMIENGKIEKQNKTNINSSEIDLNSVNPTKVKLHTVIEDLPTGFSTLLNDDDHWITTGHDFFEINYSIFNVSNGIIRNDENREFSYTETIIDNSMNLVKIRRTYLNHVNELSKCFNEDWEVVIDLNLINRGYARVFEAIHKKDRIVVSTHLTPRVDGSADVSLDIEHEGRFERAEKAIFELK